MTKIRNIAILGFVTGIFLVAAIATTVSSPGIVGIVFAQENQTDEAAEANQTAAEANQTAAEANQTAAEAANQTLASTPKLTTSDVQDIRGSLEEVKKSIADGKAVEALQTINDIDDKLLVAMSENPPPMLEQSNGNGEGDNN
jgi:plasmid stabilization system protein ParE